MPARDWLSTMIGGSALLLVSYAGYVAFLRRKPVSEAELLEALKRLGRELWWVFYEARHAQRAAPPNAHALERGDEYAQKAREDRIAILENYLERPVADARAKVAYAIGHDEDSINAAALARIKDAPVRHYVDRVGAMKERFLQEEEVLPSEEEGGGAGCAVDESRVVAVLERLEKLWVSRNAELEAVSDVSKSDFRPSDVLGICTPDWDLARDIAAVEASAHGARFGEKREALWKRIFP